MADFGLTDSVFKCIPIVSKGIPFASIASTFQIPISYFILTA